MLARCPECSAVVEIRLERADIAEATERRGAWADATDAALLREAVPRPDVAVVDP